ncbi:MAG: inositol monophosphatase [Spirochaetales bacterium]|nr:inositol monophosphatase [Spirochaetales bacterium]
MFELDSQSLDELALCIQECGSLAKERQGYIHRSFKDDGSVLTETDLEISSIVEKKVEKLFPECTFISEEFPNIRKEDSPYLFVLDPIDGTDVYSQGLPSFAVSLGILNDRLEPVGAMISCPRFGIGKESLFVRLDPGKKLLVDGKPVEIEGDKDDVRQIVVGSNAARRMDFTAFRGKTRCFGSSIIHLLCPVLFSAIQASVVPPCFVWDIASAHAVLKHVGMDIDFADGERFTYTEEFVYEKKKFRMDIFAGSDKARKDLMGLLPLKV